MGDTARLAALEAQVQQLTSRLTRLELEANATRRPQRFRHRVDEADRAPRFRPVEPAPCLNVNPCLRTSASERLDRGCASSVWSGRWSVAPAKGGANLQGADAWETQRFHPAAAAAAAAAAHAGAHDEKKERGRRTYRPATYPRPPPKSASTLALTAK